jgi:hypothetical protein
MNKCPYTASKAALKSWLEPLTSRIAKLPVDRGFPVPWFVDWLRGKPEFRAMAVHKHAKALRKRLCWVCGEPLGFNATFVIGPMCAINRVSSEPPSHHECATWSARNCPFLTMREPERREDEVTAGMRSIGGVSITRNPGVALLWTSSNWKTFSDGRGGILIDMGEPLKTEWYAHGRAATRAEVLESVRTGLPSLEAPARQEGRAALAELEKMKERAEQFYPAA